MKPIDFHPSALDFIRQQSNAIRRQIGEALRELQKGAILTMPVNRPMAVVAPGVCELRVRDEHSTVRVLYLAATPDAILVFHGFKKKSQKTPVREIHLARRRLREMLNAKTKP